MLLHFVCIPAVHHKLSHSVDWPASWECLSMRQPVRLWHGTSKESLIHLPPICRWKQSCQQGKGWWHSQPYQLLAVLLSPQSSTNTPGPSMLVRSISFSYWYWSQKVWDPVMGCCCSSRLVVAWMKSQSLQEGSTTWQEPPQGCCWLWNIRRPINKLLTDAIFRRAVTTQATRKLYPATFNPFQPLSSHLSPTNLFMV